MISSSSRTLIAALGFMGCAACGGDTTSFSLGSDTDGGAPACTPGATQACVCSGGVAGGQACSKDGLSWLACECGAAVPDVGATDTGTDAGEVDAVPDATPDATLADDGPEIGDISEAGDLSDGDGEVDAPIGPVDPWLAPAESDQWRALWNYRGRLPNNSSENALWISDPLAGSPQSIATLSGLESLGLSCDHGCFASPDLAWLAAATGPATADGVTLAIGKLNSALEVDLIKGVTWEDMVDFHFAGTKLFYSERASCVGVSCQFGIYRVDLAGDPSKRDLVTTYPPQADLEQSTYRGHFTVSPDGSKLILLNTTIRSVRVHMWKEGLGLVPLDFLCELGAEGNCSGTGSQYSDVDPVAISPDGHRAVFFTASDRYQHIRLYDLQNPGVTVSTSASVPSGEFVEHACDPGVLQDWQWQRVLGNPVFTPDGTELIFTTETDCTILDTTVCPGGPCKPAKPRTNIKRVKVATLLEAGELTPGDIFSVTQHPFGDVVANRRVTSIAVTPDGATVLFTASPQQGQSGPLSDSDSRHRNDRELYRVRLDGTHLVQLTNDTAWLAGSASAAGP